MQELRFVHKGLNWAKRSPDPLSATSCPKPLSFQRAVLESLFGASAGDWDDESGGTDHASGRDEGDSTGTRTIARPETETKSPALYRVLLLNDDYTPMDFVIHVLQKFFQKDYTEATRIMLQVHHQGAGVAGVFSHEIAETKVYQVNQFSRQNRHPLKCTMEKA